MTTGFDYSFLYAYGLIAIALVYSYYKRLGVEKTIAINSITAMLQLGALGFVLGFAMSTKNLLYIVIMISFMLLYASYIANKRTKLAPFGFLSSFLTLSLSSVSVVGVLLLLGIIKPESSHLIPIFGMALGNSLNVFAQFIERLKSDVKLSIDSIEGKIALGASTEEALSENVRKSTKAALLPTINQLETVGIIHIPGVTVGMLLAGASPLQAVSFQLVIMFMMVAIALFSAIFASSFCLHKIIK